ncbi:MAG: GNAT family N-acetyltransferase [Alphaproteobacteria bacterium]|nr:GNAT family N-acetyltransferase [Alphaproteobacteria bacterium]
MLYLIKPDNYSLHRQDLDEMYKLRYRVFCKELKWEVKTHNGMEKDEFDEKNAYYIIAKDENGVVRGCQRLIEMTNPCMLDGSFSGLLTSLKDFKHAGYWEASRFAVDHMYDESYTLKDSQILVPTLLAGVMEFGLQIEKVECFLTLSFPGVAKLAALYGLLMAPLKQSEISGETVVISGYPPLNVSYKKLLKKIKWTSSEPLLRYLDPALKNTYFFKINQDKYRSMSGLS